MDKSTLYKLRTLAESAINRSFADGQEKNGDDGYENNSVVIELEHALEHVNDAYDNCEFLEDDSPMDEPYKPHDKENIDSIAVLVKDIDHAIARLVLAKYHLTKYEYKQENEK
ncbi:MAG: hypothetical protein LBG17_03220 [Bacteroidales bacterium]|jgi:hypothetical protein|nr:hypothetical protein [Bacteroidales bacterium]